MYCVDFVADKIVSGGRDRMVKMYAFISTICHGETHEADGHRQLLCVIDGKTSLSPGGGSYVRNSVWDVASMHDSQDVSNEKLAHSIGSFGKGVNSNSRHTTYAVLFGNFGNDHAECSLFASPSM